MKVASIDFDGTLIDNVGISLSCFNRTLESLGAAPITLDRYRQVCDMRNKWKFMHEAGVPMHRLFFMMVSPKRQQRILAQFREMYYRQLPEVCLREGVVDGLQSLKDQGVSMIVWSNSHRPVIEEQAARLNIRPFFSDILCAGEGRTGRKAGWLKGYLSARRIAAGDVVAIGDTTEEPETAHAIGSWSIALTGGYASRERLEASRPHHMVDSWGEIPIVVPDLLANRGPR